VKSTVATPTRIGLILGFPFLLRFRNRPRDRIRDGERLSTVGLFPNGPCQQAGQGRESLRRRRRDDDLLTERAR
jgi:hypothetical protein